MDFYHSLNRGVEKRNIVMDDHDRLRFIHDVFVFNDTRYALHPKQSERKVEGRKREKLVRIHAFCLMNNHYHFLLSERVQGGIPRFMHKLNMGYGKYFNERHGRDGTLWQGTYKRILIERDAHFNYIPFYIHLNPLDYSFPEWREGRVKNPRKALTALREYRWSSHLDYLGVKNFPSLTNRGHILDGVTPAAYEKEITQIIADPTMTALSAIIE